jgi:hypothetical protein
VTGRIGGVVVSRVMALARPKRLGSARS